MSRRKLILISSGVVGLFVVLTVMAFVLAGISPKPKPHTQIPNKGVTQLSMADVNRLEDELNSGNAITEAKALLPLNAKQLKPGETVIPKGAKMTFDRKTSFCTSKVCDVQTLVTYLDGKKTPLLTYLVKDSDSSEWRIFVSNKR